MTLEVPSYSGQVIKTRTTSGESLFFQWSMRLTCSVPQYSYNQSNDMSIYDVEDRSPSAHGLLAQMASTRTKLQARRQNEEPPSVFPTPKPAPLPQGINRSNTSATTTDSHEMTIPDRQDFPVPSPARPESMTTPAGEGRGNMRSPPGSGAMHSGGAGRAQW